MRESYGTMHQSHQRRRASSSDDTSGHDEREPMMFGGSGSSGGMGGGVGGESSSTRSFTRASGPRQRDEQRSFAKTVVCVCIAVLVILALAGFVFHNLHHELAEFVAVVRHQGGVAAVVVFVLTFAVWLVCWMPGTPMALLAGFLFGWPAGIPWCIAGRILGSVLSFWAGQALRDRVLASPSLRKNKLLLSIQRALQRNPVKVLSLVQLAYIPMPIKNYGLAALGVNFWPFFASLPVQLPYDIIEPWMGASAHDLNAVLSGHGGATMHQSEIGLVVAGLIIAALSIILIGVLAKRELSALDAGGGGGDAAENGNSGVDYESAGPDGRMGGGSASNKIIPGRP